MEERLREIKRAVDSYEGAVKLVVTKPQVLIDDFNWLIEKVIGLKDYNNALQDTCVLNGELVVRYEEALKEIAEYGGTDMLGKTCAKVAKEALELSK